MKTALISDIHGNAEALSAVLADIKRNEVDTIICLGDIATLGPSPKETVEMVRDLKCLCIKGNHDEVLSTPEKASDYNIGNNLVSSLHWCLDQLDTEDLNFLNSFVPAATFQLTDKKSMLCYHGSPQSSIGSVLPTTPDETLDKLFDFDKGIAVAVGGHSHVQILRQYRDILIINPGSVGYAFRVPSRSATTPTLSPVAEYAIVDCDEDQTSVDFKRIPFDCDAFLSTLDKSDLPLKPWIQEQYKQFT